MKNTAANVGTKKIQEAAPNITITEKKEKQVKQIAST